jgi:hypothetical protein
MKYNTAYKYSLLIIIKHMLYWYCVLITQKYIKLNRKIKKKYMIRQIYRALGLRAMKV